MTPKGKTSRTRIEDPGSAFLAVVIVVLALAGLSAAFLQTTMQDSAGNRGSEERARVEYIAEAGITHAVSEILAAKEGNVGSRDAPVAFGGGAYYARTVDHGEDTYTVTSFGVLNRERHAIEVVIAPEEEPLFSKSLFGDLDLGARGNVFTDSYDSELGTYASQAVNFDAEVGRAFAGERGDLGSNRNILLRGGVTVVGNASPGPGYTVQISGTNVYVRGSTAPAPAPTNLPPVEYAPPIPASGAFSSSSAKDVTLAAGVYRYESFSAAGKGKVRVQGDVTIYVDGTFQLSGQSQLVIEEDSSLTIIQDGDTFSLTGGGMVNVTQKPSAFKLFSAARAVKFSGSSVFHGAVFAPNATIDPTGTTQIFGSFVGRSIDIGGTADFHFDVALSRESQESRTRLRRVSWRRVNSADR